MTPSTETKGKAEELLRFAFEYPESLKNNHGFREEVAAFLGIDISPEAQLASAEENVPPLD